MTFLSEFGDDSGDDDDSTPASYSSHCFFPRLKPIPFLIPRRHCCYLPVQIEFAYYNTIRCVDLTMHEIVLDSKKKKTINILQLTSRIKREENLVCRELKMNRRKKSVIYIIL